MNLNDPTDVGTDMSLCTPLACDPTDMGTDVNLCTPLTCRISLLWEEFEFQQILYITFLFAAHSKAQFESLTIRTLSILSHLSFLGFGLEKQKYPRGVW